MNTLFNPATKILLENSKSILERNKIMALTEGEMANVNNTMISNLYKSALEKAHVDFEDIPTSQGDITKYVGYKSMMDSMTIIEEIAKKSNTHIADLTIVRTAVENITAYREAFEKGFKLQKEFIMLQYCTLVYACVESVSTIISSYVDFIKRPDKIEFTIIRNNKSGGWLCLENLNKFNTSVKKGEFAKVLNAVVNSGKEGFIGVDDLIVPTLIIGGVLILVPLIRELIFYFYYSRMRLSDYLRQQAAFLELNKNNVQSSGIAANKKKEVLKKQSETIETLKSWADKIKVNHVQSESKSMDEMNKENKSWTIDQVQTQAVSSDQNGFKLL